jgi:hypothetical protein
MKPYIRDSLQANMAPIADDVVVNAACLSAKSNLIATMEPTKRRAASMVTIDAANLIEAAGLAILEPRIAENGLLPLYVLEHGARPYAHNIGDL